MRSPDQVERRVLSPEAAQALEDEMINRERWAEGLRRHFELGQPIARIAGELNFDRKTVRRSLRQEAWQPYSRPVPTDTLLA